MKIIVTAAGGGSRFVLQGIKTPKYKIIANKHSLLYWSMMSLKTFFHEDFIFIFNKKTYDEAFVKSELKKIKIKKYQIIQLPKVTDGQATTVMQADKFIDDNESILIYNIDTCVKPNIINRSILKYDGNVTTAQMKGDHWSFVKINRQGFATQVTEKRRISPHCSVGSYYFKRYDDFKFIYKKYINEIKKVYREAYIAPMYQYLINRDKKVNILCMNKSDIISLGTPDEVIKFDKNYLSHNS